MNLGHRDIDVLVHQLLLNFIN